MDLPPLTFGICTYKRPHYACLTIASIIEKVGYGGPVRFHIADGGSPQEDIDYYRRMTQNYPTTVEVTDNLASMVNSCARNGGDVWCTILDDFMPNERIDLTPDVLMLLEHPEIGAVRMGRLAFWANGEDEPGVFAELVHRQGLHWWRINKEKSNHHYMITIGFTLYHRRFWNAYGDIHPVEPKVPGNAELRGNERFYQYDGPTIAIPIRFGEDCLERKEPIWHFGTWRTDDYASTAGSRF